MRPLPSGTDIARIGDWELVLELDLDARGDGASTLFFARRSGPRRFSRFGALWYMGPFLGDDAGLGDALTRAAERASQVAHPCLVAIQDVGVAGASRYVVTDYVEGGSLAQLVGAGGPLPTEVVTAVALDALAGLHALHAAKDGSGRRLGLVHGCITPRSIVVGADGRTRLSDVGLVPFAGSAHGAYVAPEVRRGEARTERADLYSVGAVLFEALAGGRLGGAAGPLPLLSTLDASIPAPVAEVIARAVAPDPDLRFATADAMSAALERAAPRATAREVGALVTARLGPAIERLREAKGAWTVDRSAAVGDIEARSFVMTAYLRARKGLRRRRWLRRALAIAALVALGTALGLVARAVL